MSNPTIQQIQLTDEDRFRAAAAAWAEAQAPLEANPTADNDDWGRYLALIAPGESAGRAAEMGGLWGCALFGRAYLRATLSPARLYPALLRPYRTQMAMVDVEGCASSAGAVRGTFARLGTVRPTFAVRPGDVVRVGAPEHVFVVLEAETTGEDIAVRSVEVHRTTGGWQQVRLLDRMLRPSISGYFDHPAEGAPRKVLTVYDWWVMAMFYGVAPGIADAAGVALDPTAEV